MTLQPEDIQSKQFHVRFRGFDVEEVDSFLEQVAESLLLLQEENRTLKVKIDEMTRDLGVFKQDEVTFKNAILSAQKVADEMIKKSRNDASRMLAQAKNEVTLLRDEANREIAALETRVDQLRGMQGKLMADLREVLNAYLGQLNDPALNAPTPPLRTTDSPAAVMAKPAPAQVQRQEAPLYEKITVGDDEPWLEGDDISLQGGGEFHEPGLEDEPSVGEFSLEEGPQVTIPALEDDVRFSLEDDPLDREVGRRKR